MNGLPLHGNPFPFGLTFVPIEALGPVVGAPGDPASDLVEAAVALKAAFAFVPAAAPWADRAVVALGDAEIAPMWAVDGPLWPMIEARGTLEGLRATLTRAEEIGVEIESRLAACSAQLARGAALGARAFVLAEDLAGSDGPLVAPDFAIAELLPRYARLVDEARALGLPSVLHSDGDIRPLLPAIARAGFVAVHAGGGLGFEAFDRLFWASRDAELAVIGGLLTSELGNPARAEALGSAIGVIARAGGLLVADDGGITTSAEVANLVASVAAARGR